MNTITVHRLRFRLSRCGPTADTDAPALQRAKLAIHLGRQNQPMGLNEGVPAHSVSQPSNAGKHPLAPPCKTSVRPIHNAERACWKTSDASLIEWPRVPAQGRFASARDGSASILCGRLRTHDVGHPLTPSATANHALALLVWHTPAGRRSALDVRAPARGPARRARRLRTVADESRRPDVRGGKRPGPSCDREVQR